MNFENLVLIPRSDMTDDSLEFRSYGYTTWNASGFGYKLGINIIKFFEFERNR